MIIIYNIDCLTIDTKDIWYSTSNIYVVKKKAQRKIDERVTGCNLFYFLKLYIFPKRNGSYTRDYKFDHQLFLRLQQKAALNNFFICLLLQSWKQLGAIQAKRISLYHKAIAQCLLHSIKDIWGHNHAHAKQLLSFWTIIRKKGHISLNEGEDKLTSTKFWSRQFKIF